MKQRTQLCATARAAAVALAITACQFAHAHAHPIRQAPAAGATVSTSTKAVTIDFDDRIEPAFSTITVVDAQGKAATRAKSVVDPSNRKRMSVALNPLGPGVYTVSWVAVATDGHRTQGRYTFTVK